MTCRGVSAGRASSPSLRALPLLACPALWPAGQCRWPCPRVVPHPNLAHSTLVMVSNRFLISKSCPAIPPKVSVEACYPLPSLPPFEVADIWFQLQSNGQLPRSAQDKHSGHGGRLLFPDCQSHALPSRGRASPPVPLDFTASPPTSLPTPSATEHLQERLSSGLGLSCSPRVRSFQRLILESCLHPYPGGTRRERAGPRHCS